jgi:hypothetical protein
MVLATYLAPERTILTCSSKNLIANWSFRDCAFVDEAVVADFNDSGSLLRIHKLTSIENGVAI